jgi:hypothetical protein
MTMTTHVLPRSGTASDRPDISEANEILGSQTGSQQ